MRSEWKTVRLRDIISTVIDYRGKTPKKLGGDWSDHGYRALSAKNIKTGQIVRPESIHLVDEEMYKRWMKEEIKRGDILITSEAPFGEVLLWDSDEKIVLSQRLFALRCNGDFYPPFLYYYMTSTGFQNELCGRATGTTVVGLRQPELLNCRVEVPPLAEQHRIAGILSSLDDKIELNTKMNATLEQTAQAIFKSWFVDFDPFGGTPPSDWRKGTLSDLGDIVGGSTPSKSQSEYYTEHGIAWLTPKDLSNSRSKFIAHGSTDITELGLRNSSACLMPGGTVLFSSRAPIGYIAIASNELCTSQGFKSIVPRKEVGTAFIYHFLVENLPAIENMASGSTFMEISGSTMKSIPALIPDNDALRRFQVESTPIVEKQQSLEAENTHLSALRDTLLQKLVSGEINPLSSDSTTTAKER